MVETQMLFQKILLRTVEFLRMVEGLLGKCKGIERLLAGAFIVTEAAVDKIKTQKGITRQVYT